MIKKIHAGPGQNHYGVTRHSNKTSFSIREGVRDKKNSIFFFYFTQVKERLSKENRAKERRVKREQMEG